MPYSLSKKKKKKIPQSFTQYCFNSSLVKFNSFWDCPQKGNMAPGYCRVRMTRLTTEELNITELHFGSHFYQLPL